MISAKLPARAWASLTKCMSTDAQQQQRWQLSQPSNAAPATYTAGAGFGIWLPQSCLVGAHALLHSARTYSGSVPLLQSASSGRQVYTPACMGAATQGRQAGKQAGGSSSAQKERMGSGCRVDDYDSQAAPGCSARCGGNPMADPAPPQPPQPLHPTFHANLAGRWVGAVVKSLAPGQPCVWVWALELVGGIVLAGGGKVEL